MTTFIYVTLICPKHFRALKWGGYVQKVLSVLHGETEVYIEILLNKIRECSL